VAIAHSLAIETGYVVPPATNPADYYRTLLQPHSTATSQKLTLIVTTGCFGHSVVELINYDFQATKPENIESMVKNYKASSYCADVESTMEEAHAKYESSPPLVCDNPPVATEPPSIRDELNVRSVPMQDKGKGAPEKYGTNPFMQFLILVARNLLAYSRDPGFYWTRLIMYSFLAIMMGYEPISLPPLVTIGR